MVGENFYVDSSSSRNLETDRKPMMSHSKVHFLKNKLFVIIQSSFIHFQQLASNTSKVTQFLPQFLVNRDPALRSRNTFQNLSTMIHN